MDQMNQPVTGASGQPNWQVPSKPSEAPAASSHSPIYLWIVIIVGLAAAAGLWWYNQMLNLELDNAAEGMMQQYQHIQPAAEDSSAVADIEASLQEMNFDDLDQELDNIGIELSQ